MDWSWNIKWTGAEGLLKTEHIHRKQFSENLLSSADKIPRNKIKLKVVFHVKITKLIILGEV